MTAVNTVDIRIKVFYDRKNACHGSAPHSRIALIRRYRPRGDRIIAVLAFRRRTLALTLDGESG